MMDAAGERFVCESRIEILVYVISCTNMMRMAAVCTDDTCEVWMGMRKCVERVFL